MVMANLVDVVSNKTGLELADVLREFFDEYRQKYGCSWQELKAVNAILKCRTAQMGGLLRICDSCGRWKFIWKACKNRNCNKCGAFERAKWLAGLSRLLLPIHYHQVVFTIDHEINDIAYHNQKLIYDLLFRCASETLKEFGQKYLNGQLGFTGVLHTWGQQIQPHIHLHFMVTGGALVRTVEGYEWKQSNPTFLFPVVELSAAFRDRFCDGLQKLFEQDELELVGRCAEANVPKMIERMRRRGWEVFIQKPPVAKKRASRSSVQDEREEGEGIKFSEPVGVQQLLDPMNLAEYLGRYIHQSAISNSRLLDIDDEYVNFRYYDNRDKDEQGRGKQKEMALPGVEFIRRILWHVLPKGYIRIRHYGLHASGCRPKLQIARFILGLPLEIPSKPQLDLSKWLQSLGHEAPERCPFCKSGTMRKYRKIGSLYGWRLILLMLLGVMYQSFFRETEQSA